jgi:LacI family transcriptional regulator
MNAAAGEFGLRLILGETFTNGAINPMIERREIDGAVVFMSGSLTPQEYQHVFDELRQHVPIVWAMGMEITATGVDHVSTDNIRIGYLAHAYLHGRGCRHVAFLTSDPIWPFMRLRGQSFLNAAHDVGQAGSAYIVVRPGYDEERYGAQVVSSDTLDGLVARFAAADPRPTGLFCGNDQTTARVYPMLMRHGVQPGRDVTVVSCDNEEIRLSGLEPRPATIDIGAEQIGFRAVIRLQARLERPDEVPLSIHVAPRLVLPGQRGE